MYTKTGYQAFRIGLLYGRTKQAHQWPGMMSMVSLGLYSSGKSRSLRWYFATDVSAQRVGPIFEGQAAQALLTPYRSAITAVDGGVCK